MIGKNIIKTISSSDMMEMDSGHDMKSMQKESQKTSDVKKPSKNLLFGVGLFSVVAIAVSIVIVLKFSQA